jgi:hypothetical protein
MITSLLATAAAAERPVLALRPARLRLAARGVELLGGVGGALERPCSTCGGAGFLPVLLDERCSGCQGDGCSDVERRLVCGVEAIEECGDCRATGLEPTELGRVLLAHGAELATFLKRWRGRRAS